MLETPLHFLIRAALFLHYCLNMRIHTFAGWETAVFLLNVLAFLLMGLQARTIVGAMAPDRLTRP